MKVNKKRRAGGISHRHEPPESIPQKIGLDQVKRFVLNLRNLGFHPLFKERIHPAVEPSPSLEKNKQNDQSRPRQEGVF
jgi:hypothetical protein